jgi:hypothetical protein
VTFTLAAVVALLGSALAVFVTPLRRAPKPALQPAGR